MRHFYYALSVNYPNEKHYARLGVVNDGCNIRTRFDGKDGFGGEVHIVQPCYTKREAEQLVDFWNQCYQKNGTLYTW